MSFLIESVREQIRETREALTEQIRDLTGDMKQTSMSVVRIEQVQEASVRDRKEMREDIRELKKAFTDHINSENSWQSGIERKVEEAASKAAAVVVKIDEIAPVAREHEKLLQQARGGATAVRVLWGVLVFVLGGGGGAAILHLLKQHP